MSPDIPFSEKNAFKKRISLVMGQKSQLVWDLPASETFLIHKEIYEIPDREYKQQQTILWICWISMVFSGKTGAPAFARRTDEM